ncbi:hypothetical protein SANTM175S_03319 [Streptomyces antimycoticus]
MFAAAALAIEDLSPSLAHRLLGPLRLALGDIHTYPRPYMGRQPVTRDDLTDTRPPSPANT